MDSRNLKRMKVINFLFSYSFDSHPELEEVLEEEIDEYNLSLEIINKINEIDEIITSCLTNYKINRLNKVDLAIIRYFTYEMKYLKIPVAVSINEAVEITKVYSDVDGNKQHQFNNKLLDTIKEFINDK